MRKARMIVGMPSQNVSLKMFVAPEVEPSHDSLVKTIVDSLQSTLNTCDLSLEVDTSTMQAGRTKHTTIAIFCVPKKTPEKNGAQ